MVFSQAIIVGIGTTRQHLHIFVRDVSVKDKWRGMVEGAYVRQSSPWFIINFNRHLDLLLEFQND